MKDHTSRVVWITGATSGLGRSLARVFAERGDIVVATGRRLGALQALKKEFLEKEMVFPLYACDVTKPAAVRRTAARIEKEFGRIDVLINNAGITVFKSLRETSLREFDEILRTNLRGSFLTLKAVLEGMIRRKSGLIVNIISYAAKTTYTGSGAYSASKSGTEALMNVLREELRPYRVKVMNVYPGAIETPMWHQTHRRRYGRVMMPADDVAELIYEATRRPRPLTIEELVVRPEVGDIRV
jgi:3-oxoacyl-[acyl-carrier protein] reductase